MSLARHPRRLVASAAVGVCAVAGVALFADAAQAHPGRTYTITTLKTGGSVWIAELETNGVRRGDGVKGVFVGTAMVASPRTVAARRAVRMMPAVYRFGDGDIYVVGFVTFARRSASGVIVGGTGAFRGAHGTFAATEAMDVLSLQP